MIVIESIRITPEILNLVARIDEFKGAWQALGRLAPDRLTALRRVATIESIGSSTRIEGSRLSDREVDRLLTNLHATSFSSRDEQEVVGYAELMELVFSSWPDILLTENHVMQLHQVLLGHSEKDAWHRGKYKTHPNNVVAFDENNRQVGIVFQTASPLDTPRLMSELVTWTVEEHGRADLHPLLVIAVFVVVFLEIHPFQDGNGRLSRVLTTLLLLQAGYEYVPYSSLESIVELNMEGYYLALRRTQGTIRTQQPDWQPWLLFFLRSLAEQVRGLEQKIEREVRVLAEMPELSAKIVEFAREHGRITMAQAIKLTDSSRNTLKQHFRDLAADGVLDRHGKGRGAWYGMGGSTISRSRDIHSAVPQLKLNLQKDEAVHLRYPISIIYTCLC